MMQHVRHLVLGRAEIVGYLLAAQRHAGLCDAVQGHFFERLSGVRRQLGGWGLFFIARFAIGNRAAGLYVTMIKNRMNALAYAADGVD